MNKENFRGGAPRILVVENDLRWRKDHQTNLTRWAYHPFLAEGQGYTLLEDAIRKANQYRCHVALVDMRLLNHFDEDDNSGLLLVPKLKPTRSVIVTGYSSDQFMPNILNEPLIDAVINKRKGSKPLKQVLDASLEKICAAKKGIKIQWQDNCSSEAIISRLLTEEHCRNVPLDEVDDLLGLLFPRANKLNIYWSDHAEKSDSVLLNVYVDEQSQPTQVQLCQIPDDKDEIEGQNMVSLWNLSAQLCE